MIRSETRRSGIIGRQIIQTRNGAARAQAAEPHERGSSSPGPVVQQVHVDYVCPWHRPLLEQTIWHTVAAPPLIGAWPRGRGSGLEEPSGTAARSVGDAQTKHKIVRIAIHNRSDWKIL